MVEQLKKDDTPIVNLVGISSSNNWILTQHLYSNIQI